MHKKYLLPLIFTCYNKMFRFAPKEITALNCVKFILHEYIFKEFGPVFLIIFIEKFTYDSICIFNIIQKFLDAGVFAIMLLLTYELGYFINDLLAKVEPQEIRTDRLRSFSAREIIFAFLIRVPVIMLVTVLASIVYRFSFYIYNIVLFLAFILHSFIHDVLFRASVTLPLLRVLRILWFSPLFSTAYAKFLTAAYAIASSIPYSLDYMLSKSKAKINSLPKSKLKFIGHGVTKVCALYMALSFLGYMIIDIEVNFTHFMLQIFCVPTYYIVFYSLKKALRWMMKEE